MYTTREILDIALELAGLESEPADTGIYIEGENIKKILIGIDMETPEIILGRELGVDLVVSHHPTSGSQIIDFHKVMEVQIDKMVEFGVPINKAQKLLSKRMQQVSISRHVENYDRNQSAAKLLGMPYMNIHMPADMITEKYVQTLLNEKLIDKPKATLSDIVDVLNEEYEYANSIGKPIIRVGSSDSYAGQIAVLMAGGTGGGEEIFKAYFEAGVGTIVCMHIPDAVKKAIETQNIGNVIVAGHMASDSIGINRIIRTWEERGIEVIKMSGIV